MKAYQNKFLKVPEKVVLTDYLDGKLVELDPYFEAAPETVTSGVRTSTGQLRIIRNLMTTAGITKKYPNVMTCKPDEKIAGKNEYVWQMAWSELLNRGYIVNPPFPATVLMDYKSGGVNKKGQQIGHSPHFYGKAIDLSGLDSLPIIQKLVDKKIVRGYRIERKQNCLHVDL